MANTPVTIANLALMSFGAQPLQSLSSATPAGSAVNAMYSAVVNQLFASYPWNFAKNTVALVPLDATVLVDGTLPNGWQNAFALPADMLGLPERILANNRFPDSPTHDFEIQGATIYSNMPALWAVGIWYVPEAAWPAYFLSAAVACLAAELCMAISGNHALLPRLEQKAYGDPRENRLGGLLGEARRIDSRANPSRYLARNPLVDVRNGSIDVLSTGANFA